MSEKLQSDIIFYLCCAAIFLSMTQVIFGETKAVKSKFLFDHYTTYTCSMTVGTGYETLADGSKLAWSIVIDPFNPLMESLEVLTAKGSFGIEGEFGNILDGGNGEAALESVIYEGGGRYIVTFGYTFTYNLTGGGTDPGTDPDPEPGENCTCPETCPGMENCNCGCEECSGMDDDEDPENECECGACCYCKCTCTKWTGPICIGHCQHACTEPGCPVNDMVHCECHHTHEGECCEHHYKDYVPPPDVVFADPGMPDMPHFDTPDIGGLRNQFGDGPGLPDNTRRPIGDVPGLPGPSEPVEKQPLEYFERKEDSMFPEFKYEELFEELMDLVKEKIPLDWTDGLKNGNGGQIDLRWKVHFTLWNQSYGPWEFDLRDYVDEVSTYDIVRILRLIALFVLCVFFLLAVMDLIFGSR